MTAGLSNGYCSRQMLTLHGLGWVAKDRNHQKWSILMMFLHCFYCKFFSERISLLIVVVEIVES